MIVTLTCDRCHNTFQEDYQTFERNNPRSRKSFSATCDFCTRHAQAKADWVAIARTEYKGWLGPFGRWLCGVMAASMFEQAWTHKPLTPDKYWWEPLPMSDEQIVRTALGEFHCHKTDDGIKVTSGPGHRPDVPPAAPPKTRQQAIEDRFMENQVYKHANNQRHVFEKDPASLFDICLAVRSMGGSVIIVDGEVIPLPLHEVKGQLLSYSANGLSFEAVEEQADAWQVDRRLDSIYLDQINGVWEWHAAFVPRAEAEVVEPADKFTDELVSSKLNIHDLCRVMELAFDKAGPDKDISVVMEYKHVGDVAKAEVKIEVLGVHQVTNNVSIDLKADSPEQVARDLAAMMADKGSPDVTVETIDLGYGSEFDLLMMAATRCLREVVQANNNLSVSALTFINNADLYNQWYEAVKADRRREWEISNTPHPEV